MSKEIQVQVKTTEAAHKRDVEAMGASYEVVSVEALKLESDGVGRSNLVDPVSVLAVAGLALIAKNIVENHLKTSEKGVVIDLRTTPMTVSYIENAPRGFVVIVGEDGSREVHQGKYQSGEKLAELLQSLSK